MRQERLDAKTTEEISTLDDDMAKYAIGRAIGPQVELQKLKEQVESVTRKMKRKHEDLLDYDTMAFEEQLPVEFKLPNMMKFNRNGDPRVHLRQ